MHNIPGMVLQAYFYKTANGREPVREWLRAMPMEQKKTIGEEIKTVQFGWPIGMPIVRKIGTGLWEIRSHFKNGIARVFFTVYGDKMILLHGFVKKAQKTPLEELAVTPQRKKDFLKEGI
ncbi:MAG: type II toxin-antitoxin system RelE/ParE family toxin [Fibrobacterota bacterium]